MHVLYAYELKAISNEEQASKSLSNSINKAFELLYFNLSLLVRIADFIEQQAARKATKFLPKKEDLDFNTRITENPVILSLKENKKISSLLKLQPSEEEKELIRDFYKKLLKKSTYKDYCQSEQSLENEQAIILSLYKDVITKNQDYREYVEQNFPACLNDLSKINFMLESIIQSFKNNNIDKLLPSPDKNSQEEEFAYELLEKTLDNNDKLTKLIEPKLENWDLDRIAQMDMILMKMALCELLYFPQIPVKVSINEYIDISKIYSTPKSKDFINGVLDKIMHELREQGAIVKKGRGLVE